jgi:DNA mismatch endonuclease (patch repair protein)
MMPEYKRDKRSPIPKSEGVSKIMSSVKGQNTKPELMLRKLLYVAGSRGYRVNYKQLPGKPDVVFTKKRVAIFVHGCFWHGCKVCGGRVPKHNNDYWSKKLQANIDRDTKRRAQLEEMNYTVIEIWEHELKNDAPKVIASITKVIKSISTA